MRDIHISDPAWRTTFPYLVAPLPNEWLAGVLLRCDERNCWGSGTTLGYVLRPGSKQSAMNELSTIVPTVIDLEMLAQVLSVPVSHMVATTYLAELARLYGSQHLHAKLLSSSFPFHVCPACIAEERKLSRWLTLPHIMHCPEHHLSLVSSCSCGAALRLFHRKSRPFTCCKCAWIGKTSRTSRETLHEWKRNNTCSPPTIFSGHVARQNCSPALSDLSKTVWSKKGKSVRLFPTQIPTRFPMGDRTRWRLRSALSFMPFGSLMCRLVMWWPMKVPCPGDRSSG